MIITVTENMFVEGFRIAGLGDHFSRAGLTALFEYITELEDDIDDQKEFDIIELCGDFSEYRDIQEYNNAFDAEYDHRESVACCVAYVGEAGLLCVN